MKINRVRGYRSAGKRLWGWIITTKRSQYFIGIKTRIAP